MRISVLQKVFLKNEDTKYQCETCKFWIEGIGNWGGCAVVHPVGGEISGLHIHRKSSCKYWEKGSSELATEDDELGETFSKADALYGTSFGQASPKGFSCSTCYNWGQETKSCARFEGTKIEGYDCSDGWLPNDEAKESIDKYEDQNPPKSVEEAEQLADMYGKDIGSNMNRGDDVEITSFSGIEKNYSDSELEDLIKCLKSKTEIGLETFYKGRRAFAIGTERTYGGRKYVKTADGWEPVAEEHQPKPSTEETPRDEAEADFEEDKKEEYAFARESEFSNLGEDLIGSARHKRNEWKGLAAAEADGTAAKQVKRDNLLKEMPIDLISKTNSENYMANLVGYSLLKRYPKAPEYPGDQETGDYYTTDSETHAQFQGRFLTENFYEKHIKGGNAEPHYRKISGEEVRKKVRSDYFNTFVELKTAVEQAKYKNTDLGVMANDYKKIIMDRIKTLRVVDRYNRLANQLVPLVNKGLNHWSTGRNSAFSELSTVMRHVKAKFGNDIDVEAKKMAEEICKNVMEGNSAEKAIGEESGRKKQFNPAELYISDNVERKGPDVDLGDTANQQKMLVDDFKMRGIQWGNSVTDSEREHHLKEANLALSDLTDVLGLPHQMASFNGRLGLAFGARGKGTAMAHYEPSLRVINLTRKNGVGSLAHEWGHFFDNVASEIGFKRKDSYLSELASYEPAIGLMDEKTMIPVGKAYFKLQPLMDGFRKRILSDRSLRAMMGKKSSYWTSGREMFARGFERYVAEKLEASGRKNTYLSANVKHGLWPTDDEIKAMTPHFDAIFSEFAKSPNLTKSFLEACENR